MKLGDVMQCDVWCVDICICINILPGGDRKGRVGPAEAADKVKRVIILL